MLSFDNLNRMVFLDIIEDECYIKEKFLCKYGRCGFTEKELNKIIKIYNLI
jgi:hypothetical protein